MRKVIGAAAFAAFVLLAWAPRAEASPITVAGTTLGCWGSGCALFGSPVTSPAPYDLTFTGTSFNVVTDALNVQLGTFTRPTDDIGTPAPSEFNLEVTFTLPLGVNGSPAPFTAVLTGFHGTPNIIDFDNSLITFHYGTSGTFQFSVNDVRLVANQSAFLTGSIVNGTLDVNVNPNAAVPEPASLVLLTTGLVALGLRLRKSTRKS